MASSNVNFVSRDEYKAKKALDEARKAGKVPAELDEEGKEINPHMPKYIIDAPWYLNQNQPSLKHHKFKEEKQKVGIENRSIKGQRVVQNVSKFRKGACENCGAMSHKSKECFERPKKVNVK